MAQDILVTDSFNRSMQLAGDKLVKRLDQMNAKVTSAFWLYITEEKTWKLVIASPSIDANGPRTYYNMILDANAKAGISEETVSLNDIAVTSPNNQIVRLLKMAVGTEANDVAGIRFSRNTVNGYFIEDCYIYRSA